MTAVARPAVAGGRAALVALAAVYAALLVWLVLFKLHEPYIGDAAARAIKLVPFVRTDAAGSSAPREVVANVALFVPFGVYGGLLLPRRWWTPVLLALFASAGFEAAQYVLAVGVTDVTDVIANTAGALVGVGIASIARRLPGGATRGLVALCVVGTVLVAVAVGIFLTGRPQPPGPVTHAAPTVVATPILDSCAC